MQESIWNLMRGKAHRGNTACNWDEVNCEAAAAGMMTGADEAVVAPLTAKLRLPSVA